MNFNSIEFFGFFAVVLLLYFAVGDRLGARGQNWIVVVAASVFYGAFELWFLALLYATVLLQYTVGRFLDQSENERTRKRLLAVALVGQLGMLGVFKYFDFFSEQVADVLGSLGFQADPVTLDLVLPVGISFFTFQSLTYVLAIYRRQIPAEPGLITFATFVMWFPNLVAGPIERASNLLPQVKRRRLPPRAPTVESAVTVIVRGLFKKVVVADSIGIYVSTVYANPDQFSWSALLAATVGFAIQVYGDFSGYSDIARGTSRLLGVEVRRNFEQPFLSRDMRELWMRWHTSLRLWFVENVAQPLGVSRRGRWGAAATVVFMFCLIGLWHGSAWTFVVWGLYNGLLVAMWRFLPRPKNRHPMKVRIREAPRILLTFALFCGGVVFFKAASLSDAATVFERIIMLEGGAAGPSSWALIPVMAISVLVLDLLERRDRITAIERIRVRATLGGVATPKEAAAESLAYRLKPVPAGLLVGVLLVGIVIYSATSPQDFIYFGF